MKRLPLLFRIFILILITSIHASCRKARDLVVEGYFPNTENASVSLSEYDDVKKVIKTENIIDGKFSMHFSSLKTGFYFIRISWPNPKPDTTISTSGKKFFDEGSFISQALYINEDESDIYRIYTNIKGGQGELTNLSSGQIFQNVSIKVVSNSPNSTLYDYLKRLSEKYQIQNQIISDSIIRLRDRSLEKKDMNSYTTLNNRVVDLWKGELLPKMLSEYRQIFKKNKHLEIVPYYVSISPDLQQYYSEYSKILKNLSGDAAKSDYAKYAFERLKALKSIGMSQVLPNPMGIEPSGASYHFDPSKNKATLIEFWASWCAPCRSSNPMLIKIYQKYKADGFEILGVSMDVNRDSWIKAIKDDRLPWRNISDLKPMSKSENAGRFNLVEIPQNYLLDRSGKIIGINLYDDALEKSLNNILKNETK